MNHDFASIIPERPTARTILLNKKNEILLLQYKLPQESFWLTPGGGIENNETPLMAAKRELLEETGINDADFITPHSYYSEEIDNYEGIQTFFKEYIFLAYNNNNPIKKTYFTEKEKQIIIATKWWDLNDFIASGDMLYPHGLLTALNDVIYNKQLPQQTVFINKTYE